MPLPSKLTPALQEHLSARAAELLSTQPEVWISYDGSAHSTHASAVAYHAFSGNGWLHFTRPAELPADTEPQPAPKRKAPAQSEPSSPTE